MIGDPVDVQGRLDDLLPPWFGEDETPVLDGVLAGQAAALSFIYSIYSYGRLQQRIATATDGFLDLVAYDFLGRSLPRQAGEADPAYRARILSALFPTRNSRPAVISAISSLTGIAPTVIEFRNPNDIGFWGSRNTATPGFMGWNAAGYWTSRLMPFQCGLIAYVVVGSGITRADVCAAIEAVRPIAVKIWVQIQDARFLDTESGQYLTSETGDALII